MEDQFIILGLNLVDGFERMSLVVVSQSFLNKVATLLYDLAYPYWFILFGF